MHGKLTENRNKARESDDKAGVYYSKRKNTFKKIKNTNKKINKSLPPSESDIFSFTTKAPNTRNKK